PPAAAKAAELSASLDNANMQGMDNSSATSWADLVVLSVPYSAQEKTLAALTDELSGKILLTVVVPLGKPVARVHRLPSGMSAAEEAQQQLGEDVRVVAAFQNISAHHLMDLEHEIDCDVLICGAKKADKAIVADLCADAGMRGVNAGSLPNASIAEGLTSLLIGINIRNKIKNAGIRITGIS
ncbi:MAG: NADPH-dependent F420 reductase, partial [Candidatus Promineifilaceae bacterium]